MGFYGNIANTSKTTFSFDLIYESRYAMEEALKKEGGDGVFLGRYVLVQYDASPISAYYNPDDGWFYNTSNFAPQSRIQEPKNGSLYQDLGNPGSMYKFYVFKNGWFEQLQEASASPYAFRFRQDVDAYGRGYDSTVWMKQFDPKNGNYIYVMTAELNAVVPTFHLILDPPSEAPTTPYFDRDTTNIDYYLHMQPSYQMRVAFAKDNGSKSDEQVKRKIITWKTDPSTGIHGWSESNQTDAGDIYYNKAGFKADVHNLEVGVVDSINYDYVQSGRCYGADPDSAAFDPNAVADDVYQWYFRLPAIGNSICQMWDKVYGNPGNGNTRYLNPAKMPNDTVERLVTYDKTTLMGMLNTVQETLGYALLPKSVITTPNAKIEASNKVTYTPTEENGKKWPTQTYVQKDCLYYEQQADGSTKFYYYAFEPLYEKFEGDSLDPNTIYFNFHEGEDHATVANAGLFKAEDAEGADVSMDFWVEKPLWKLYELKAESEDSVYGLMHGMIDLMGIGSEVTRTFDHMQGTINIMKDLLGNINPDLKPGRLLHTDPVTGKIEVTDTYFPGANVDKTRVLDGTGAWVNRLRALQVSAATSNAVTNITPTAASMVADNDNDNNIKFATGNKWVQLASNGEDLITIAHLAQASPEVKDAVNFNDNTNGTPDEQTFDTQKVAWDEAGHIIGYTTTTWTLPMSFKQYAVTAETGNETPDKANGTIVADHTLDTFNLLAGNRWINLGAHADTDGVAFSHILSGVDGDKYYGLAADQPISELDKDNTFEVPYYRVDNAGHITNSATHTVTIPENFENVKLEVAADTDIEELTSLAGEFKPTTLVDTVTFATGNKWIRARVDGKKITFAHRKSIVSPTTSTQTLENTTTFTVPSYEFDEAGHITKKDTKTITLANGFKKFTVGAASSSEADAVGHVAGSCTPDKISDELSLYNGNKWIRIGMNRNGTNSNVEDSITFSHAVIHENNVSNTVSTAETPKFGATFSVPHATIDRAGHVTILSQHNVTIPLPSLTQGEGNVTTSVALAAADGKITVSRANVGTLALTGYTKGTANSDIAAGDTINAAFSKLQTQMNDEETARANAITAEQNARQTAIEAEAKARADADTAEREAREKAVNDEKTAREKAITETTNTLTAAINAEKTAREQAITSTTNTLTTAINTEKTAREQAITKEVTDRDAAIKAAIDAVVGADVPEALDTLKELGEALKSGDAGLAGTLTTLETSVTQLTTKVDNHIANKNNPHEVAAAQVGGLEAYITNMVQGILSNFNTTLKDPKYTVTNSADSVSVVVTEFASETTIRWQKKLESGQFADTDIVPVGSYEFAADSVEDAGDYRFILTRTYMGQKTEVTSSTYTLVYEEPEVIE